MNKLIPLFCLFIFTISITNVSAYQFSYYGSDDGGTTAKVNTPSIYWGQTCSSDITLYISAGSSGAYSVSNKYLSPFENVIGVSNPMFSSNVSCKNIGTLGDGVILNNFYENSVNSTYTSFTFDSWVNVTYDCTFDNNEFFIYNNTKSVDSFGNHPFGYGAKFGTCYAQSPSQCTNDLTGDLSSVIAYVNDGYYSECGNDMRIDAEGDAYSVGSCGGISSDIDMNYWIMTPFNSMSTGIVNLSVFGGLGNKVNPAIGGTLAYELQYYLYDTVLNTTEDLGTSFPLTGTKQLIQERQYWLFIGTRYYMDNYNCGSGQTWGIEHNYTEYDISVWAYEPDWDCSDYTDCLDNVKQRICTDTNGKVANKLEYETCFDIPTVDIDLGFEEYYTENIWFCGLSYFWGTCPVWAFANKTTAKYPVNWTVIGTEISGANLENFVSISQDFKTKGSSSLRLNYYPVKEVEPITTDFVNVVCGNTTTGRSPEISADYNETLFISRNVSFDSPYIQLRYDVKKCESPIVQYDYPVTPFGTCGKRCYANECNSSIEGKYGIRITRKEGQLTDVSNLFTITNASGGDYTDRIKNISLQNQQHHNNLVNYANITLPDGKYFLDNSKINIYFSSSYSAGKVVNITDVTRTYSYGTFTNTGSGNQWKNITLTNLLPNTTSIILTNITTTPFYFYYKYIDVLIPENVTTSAVVFDYFDNAHIVTTNKIIDFSSANLQAGVNYTISVAVNPENSQDSNAHCIYMDDFSITFTEEELPECSSYCEGLTLYSAIEYATGVCDFTVVPVSSQCIDLSSTQEAIDGQNDFIYDGQKYIWNNQTGSYDVIDIPPPSDEEEAILNLYSPPDFMQGFLIALGVDEDTNGWIWFFFSIFMLINYISIGVGSYISILIGRETKDGQKDLFLPFLAVVLIIIVGALFSGFYPLEIGIPIIIGIGLMLWKNMEKIVGG